MYKTVTASNQLRERKPDGMNEEEWKLIKTWWAVSIIAVLLQQLIHILSR